MKIALDQALNTTGYSVFSADNKLITFGTFTTTKSNQTGQKLLEIYNFVDSLIQQFYPTKLVLEDIQLQSLVPGEPGLNNISTYRKLSYVQAVIMLVCVNNGLDFEIISSNTWKSSCGITGRNRKEQKKSAQEYVFKHFNVDEGEDIADSICLGVHAFNKPETELNWGE